MASHGESKLYTLAYIPLLVLQLVFVNSGTSMVLVLGLTSPLTPVDKQRETWEIVKATSGGAELTMRSRWVGVFYYMAGGLVWVLLLRVIFVWQMLTDLAHSNSYHLSDYTVGTTPHVPLWSAAAGLIVFMGAVLIQPFVMMGLNAAVGLFLSSVIRSRVVLQTVLGFWNVIYIFVFMVAGFMGITVLGADKSLSMSLHLSNGERWLSLLLFSLICDHGLRFLNLRSFTLTWQQVDYGVLLSVATAGIVLIECLLTRVLVKWAARRAARASRE